MAKIAKVGAQKLDFWVLLVENPNIFWAQTYWKKCPKKCQPHPITLSTRTRQRPESPWLIEAPEIFESNYNSVRFQIFERKFWNSTSPSSGSASIASTPWLHAGLVLHWNLQAHFSIGTSNFGWNAGKFSAENFFRFLSFWKSGPITEIGEKHLFRINWIEFRNKNRKQES